MSLRISLTIAACLIVAGFSYGWYDRDLGDLTIRRHLRQLKQQGTLPAQFQDVDIETVDLAQYDTALPGSLQLRDALSRFLLQSFWLWVPVVIAVCLAAGWVVSAVVRLLTNRAA